MKNDVKTKEILRNTVLHYYDSKITFNSFKQKINELINDFDQQLSILINVNLTKYAKFLDKESIRGFNYLLNLLDNQEIDNNNDDIKLLYDFYKIIVNVCLNNYKGQDDFCDYCNYIIKFLNENIERIKNPENKFPIIELKAV